MPDEAARRKAMDVFDEYARIMVEIAAQQPSNAAQKAKTLDKTAALFSNATGVDIGDQRERLPARKREPTGFWKGVDSEWVVAQKTVYEVIKINP